MGYLLDTNILSELRHGAKAHPNLRAWRGRIDDAQMFISVLTLGEIRRGIEEKWSGDVSGPTAFTRWLREVELLYKHRILDVNREVCMMWAHIPRSANVAAVDGLIAATAAHHGHTVATRNVRDFQRCGVDFVNPFET